MSTLIFDIETAPQSWGSFDDVTRDLLLGKTYAGMLPEDQVKRKATVQSELGLSPMTGQVVAIGVYDAEREQGAVYFQSEDEEEFVGEDGFLYKPRTEAEMLTEFWQGAEAYDTFVTFAGRVFDVPFLTIRSAVNEIAPTCDLMDHRYLTRQGSVRHVDLQDQLSYYGALGRRPSLHMSCRAFGVESSKAAGVSGADVADLFQQKRYRDIAAYNMRDVIATAGVYAHWKQYLAPACFWDDTV